MFLKAHLHIFFTWMGLPSGIPPTHETSESSHRNIRMILQQNGSVSWRLRSQMKQLAWPMAEWQIEHRKSSLVLSARFLIVKWPSRSSDCNTTQANWNCKLCLLNKLVLLPDYPIRICGCQRPRRWTRRSYCSRRSLPSLFNPLSFFSYLLLFFLTLPLSFNACYAGHYDI